MQTPRRPVTDLYGAHRVVDPYRWLEDLGSPEVSAWVDAQDRLSRGCLEGIARWSEARTELRRLCALAMRRAPRWAGGRLYWLERHGTAQQVLRVDGALRFDPGDRDPSGLTSIDWYHPSPDGHVALGLSTRGTESSTLHVLDPDGVLLADRVPDLPHATVAWRGAGFFHARMRTGAGVRAGVCFHRLGATDEEPVFPGADGAQYAVQCHGDRVLVTELRFPVARLHLSEGAGFREIGEVPAGAAVVLLADAVHVGDAAGHRRFDRQWSTVDPRPTEALHFTPAGVVRLGAGQLELDGRPLPVDEGRSVHLESGASDRAHVVVESFGAPPTIARVTEAGIDPLFPLEGHRWPTRTVQYRSDKGVSISMAVLGDPGGPVLLTAYGAGGLPYAPIYLPDAVLWLQWGGQVAIPSIRSADDDSAAWPTAGSFQSIENAYHEVIGAVGWLRAHGARWVGAYGVSHGGLVMAGALVTRPDVFDAVCCHVPLTDLLRHPVLADGWMTGYYGDPREPGHADWLTRTSPYHQVAERAYPPVLLSTGLTDARVHPSHAMKLAAALQWAGCRALLTVDRAAGHGAGKPLEAKVVELADRVAFLWPPGQGA